MSDTVQFHPEDDLTAAEYALGLAEGEVLQAARTRLRNEPGFARKVADWQERFVAMTDSIAAVAPRAQIKRALMAHLFAGGHVPLLRRLWLWQGLSVAAAGLAAVMGLALLQDRTPYPPVPSAVYAAQMTGETGALEMFAVLDTGRGDIALRRVSGGPPEGRVLELWAILPDRAPISLGVLPQDAVTRVALPAELLQQAGEITLAVSEEPPGGAPGGAPTGNIMAAGTVGEL